MKDKKAREVAMAGMLFALSIALSYFESMISPLLGLMPAMKLGLSNIVVMYALLFLNVPAGLTLVILKAAFAFLTRGVTAGALSLCGGLLSFAVFVLLMYCPFKPTGYIFTVCGALAHNIGQLLAAAVLLSSRMAFGYAPVLLFFGLLVGSLSYAISAAVFAALERLPGMKRPIIRFKKQS